MTSVQFDREHFSEVFVDLKWFESKVGNKYLNEAAGRAAEMEAASKHTHKEEVGRQVTKPGVIFARANHSDLCVFQDCSLSLAESTSSDRAIDCAQVPPVEEDDEEDDMFETEFRQYKRTYYMTKMGVDVVSEWGFF